MCWADLIEVPCQKPSQDCVRNLVLNGVDMLGTFMMFKQRISFRGIWDSSLHHHLMANYPSRRNYSRKNVHWNWCFQTKQLAYPAHWCSLCVHKFSYLAHCSNLQYSGRMYPMVANMATWDETCHVGECLPKRDATTGIQPWDKLSIHNKPSNFVVYIYIYIHMHDHFKHLNGQSGQQCGQLGQRLIKLYADFNV